MDITDIIIAKALAGGGGGGADNIIIIDLDNDISITPREAIQAIIDGKIIVWNTAAFEETITNSTAFTGLASVIDYNDGFWHMRFTDGSELVSTDIDEDFYVD